jgi:hypothetical protein
MKVSLLYLKCPYPELEAARQMEENERLRQLQAGEISGIVATPDRYSLVSQGHAAPFQQQVPYIPPAEPGPEPRTVTLRKV